MIRNRVWNIVAGGVITSTLAILVAASAAFAMNKIDLETYTTAILPVFTYWAGLFTDLSNHD